MEKVVSKKVIGSANPLARKFRGIKGAFQGIGCGIVSLIIGFVLIISSVTAVKENSKVIEATELKTPTMVEGEQGYVKIHGIPSDVEDIPFTYSIINQNNSNEYIYDDGVNNYDYEVDDYFYDSDDYYDFEYDYYDDIDDDYNEYNDNEYTTLDEKNKTIETFSDFLYLDAAFERFEVVEEVRTETRRRVENGQDIEETVEITEYKEKWVKKDSTTLTPYFSLGSIRINPQRASFKLNLQSKTVNNVYIPNLDRINTYGQAISQQVGNTRLVISYIPNNQEMIVAGELSGDQISSGDPFIVSNKSDTELVQNLKTEESIMRWGLRIGAWLLLTIGFGMILAPILEILDIIPFLGKMVKGLAFFVSAFVSFLIVLFVTILIKFWYLALLLVFLLFGAIGFLVFKLITKKEPKKEEKTE